MGPYLVRVPVTRFEWVIDPPCRIVVCGSQRFYRDTEKRLYMDLQDPRGWVFYYLICFVALLWVGFLSAQGVMIFVSLFLTLIVLGFSVILCVMLIFELRKERGE